jgi:lipopolysaccharide biosynthesis glycosyltransferase
MPSAQALAAYAQNQFSNHPRVAFPIAATDAEVDNFMATGIGLLYSKDNRISRMRWAKDNQGFEGVKPTCVATKNEKKVLFYLLTSADDFYFYQLQLSICSVRESNPELDICVGVVPEYFANEETLQSVMNFLLEEIKVRIFFFEKFEFEDMGPFKRFSKNWLRLRLWELGDYFDTILYVDADVIIQRDISTLLTLNVPFASANDIDMVGNNRFSSFGKIQAGVLLIQPCKQTFLQMRAILSNNDISAFTHNMAEQSFLDWYYKFDGFRLGAQYNAISAVFDGLYRQSNQSDSAKDEELRPQPYIVHFTSDKITRDSDLSQNMQWMARECHQRTRDVVPDFI